MKVAAVQLNSNADQAANLAVVDRLTRAAAADGARLIVLPEKWTAIGTDEQLRAAAEPLDGPAVRWARAIARELGVDLVAGSILELVPGQEKLANTSVRVSAESFSIFGIAARIFLMRLAKSRLRLLPSRIRSDSSFFKAASRASRPNLTP